MEKTQTKKPVANVVCIKWGQVYTAHDVNCLYAMVKRNMKKHELRFFCFTDDATGLTPEILSQPLPVMKCNPEDVKYAYQKEAGLCDDELGGLNGQRVLFFDLDVVITGELDCFVSYPLGDDFVIINDWSVKSERVGQATCYSWRVGTLGFIKEYFEAHPKEVVKQFYTASQEYLSAKVIEKWGRLKFWPEEWCRSFKFHALPVWYLRFFVEPKLPEGTKVLAFHGHPKIADAICGVWSPEGLPFFKCVYKTIRPSPWISQYWNMQK
ncbi:MAG: hypothetical protein ABFQ95_00015 [Pseudomonadota bacterium]